jgi:DNA invertase Pin-like site-specific DNA recombinase
MSGTKESADRPAWSDLMTALHSNGVKIVIVEKLDRLAHDLMVQETIVADLRRYGFALVSAAEPDLMANDPSRILVRQMMGAVANMRSPRSS